MRKETMLLVFFLCILHNIIFTNCLTDESSLLAIKAHITSDPNNNLATNWSQGTDFCTWVGVTCSQRHLRVTRLDLFNMSLQGTIAKEIGNLSFLSYLRISNNSFNGVIPDEIGKLRRLRVVYMLYNQLSGDVPLTIFNITSLEELGLNHNQLSGVVPLDIGYRLPNLEGLYLSGNQFSGNIPASLTECSRLETIDLSDNGFVGSIPAQIGDLSELRQLLLGPNNLTGIIPPSICNLSNLLMLELTQNNLQGQIPMEIGYLSKLTFLNLATNMLEGETPPHIFNLSRLETLSLAGNELLGELPFFIDRWLPNLEALYLGSNHFSGRIPTSISNLSNLIDFDVAQNRFVGLIPITLGNLPNLEYLNVQRNNLRVDLSVPNQNFLLSLQECKNLNILSLSANSITGVLPNSIGSSNMSKSLVRFDCFECGLRGEIPYGIGNFSSLIYMGLGDNELTGAIPSTLGEMNSLQRLVMYTNNLHGSIPDSFCSLNNLYFANFMSNSLSGQVPSCVGTMPSLQELHLAYNSFSSNIPSTLWSNERIVRINFSSNFFDGSLSLEIGNLRGMTVLDLSGNQFSGEIPNTFGQLQSLERLSLSNNKLHGPIPVNFDDLRGIQYLDLSLNNLTGEIPTSLETLTYLNHFNVSYNMLVGEIPEGGSFVNFTAELFIGNRGLCGSPKFMVKACKENAPKSSSKTRILRYILPPIAFVAIVITLFLIYRARKLPQQSNSLLDIPLERMSYFELVRATNYLDEGNLIGRGSIGSVYKGILSNGKVAAFKVFNLDVQGAIKSFDIECQVLSTVRHRNLVKVITSCTNLEFKALVLEYMHNGNLDKWLHSLNHTLNFSQRLGIMIDVASAIEYLHQGYSSPIVHCDIKPSNILLDEYMVAHLGDFGIAKLMTEDIRIAQTKTMGTMGYMAPEYGSSGIVSATVDVYSYGILLMETFTGKKPTDEMFIGDSTMKSWVFNSFPNAIMEIVDTTLWNEDECIGGANVDEDCLELVMGLALECTVDRPEGRVDIKDVVVRLKKIKVDLEKLFQPKI